MRRTAAMEDKAASRLGQGWHVLDWPLAPVATDTATVSRKTPPLTGFLAIGPGGVFAVSVAQHGRYRVLIAGDIIQVDGRRPSYVSQARRDARKVGKYLSAAIGYDIKVFPVLAFVGSGTISVNGVPKDCVITSYRELDKVLTSTGQRISASTASKLSQVAKSPWTWTDTSGYQWYPEGATTGDKGTTRG
nr:nuclease-related domain-containing protein [Catelliglobosispora koreensis]